MSREEVVEHEIVKHTRLSDDGRCSCGVQVALGRSFAAHQAAHILTALATISDSRGEFTRPEPIEVVVKDPATGEVLESRTLANDFMILCAGNRYVKNVQAYPGTGTQVVTVARD